jgi:hypothetical protein
VGVRWDQIRLCRALSGHLRCCYFRSECPQIAPPPGSAPLDPCCPSDGARPVSPKSSRRRECRFHGRAALCLVRGQAGPPLLRSRERSTARRTSAGASSGGDLLRLSPSATGVIPEPASFGFWLRFGSPEPDHFQGALFGHTLIATIQQRKTPHLRGFPIAGAGFEPATFGL